MATTLPFGSSNSAKSIPFGGSAAPTPTTPSASLSDRIWSGLANVSQGAAKGAIGGIADTAGLLASGGGLIEKGLDQTVGRVGNAVAGKGLVPSNTATGAQQGASDLGGVSSIPQLTPTNTEQKVGSVIGQAADALVTPPGGAVGGKAGAVIGEGARTLGGEVGTGVAAFKASEDAKAAANTDRILSDALTPKLTATKYAAAAKAGDVAAPTLNGAGKVAEDSNAVQQAVSGVKAAAQVLGKKATDIINNGTFSTVSKNIANVTNTIAEYSQKAVQPFLKANPVDTNFADFIDYIKGVKMPPALTGDAASSFERVRERVIGAVYKSVQRQSASAGEFGASTDPNIYWNARKEIDGIIKEELGAKTFTDPGRSGIKQAANSLRKGVADFISDSLRFPGQMEGVARYRSFINEMADRGIQLKPDQLDSMARQMGLNPTGAQAADAWEQHMNVLQGLYKAGDNLATRVAGEQGKTAVQIAAKKHPGLTQLGKTAALGAAGAVGAGSVYEVGKGLLGD